MSKQRPGLWQVSLCMCAAALVFSFTNGDDEIIGPVLALAMYEYFRFMWGADSG